MTDWLAVKIKLSPIGGCFHREHSPSAYQEIDTYLHSHDLEKNSIEFEEHESGPEILAYVVVGAELIKSIIELITAVLRARQNGLKRGDKPGEGMKLFIRRVDEDNKSSRELVLTIRPSDKIDSDTIEKALTRSISRMTK